MPIKRRAPPRRSAKTRQQRPDTSTGSPDTTERPLITTDPIDAILDLWTDKQYEKIWNDLGFTSPAETTAEIGNTMIKVFGTGGGFQARNDEEQANVEMDHMYLTALGNGTPLKGIYVHYPPPPESSVMSSETSSSSSSSSSSNSDDSSSEDNDPVLKLLEFASSLG